MIKATKIKMKQGYTCSDDLMEIEKIYLEGCKEEGYYNKETIYDFLKSNPNTIEVNLYPYPNLQPVISKNNEKYVRSKPNYSGQDNLLCLPRE